LFGGKDERVIRAIPAKRIFFLRKNDPFQLPEKERVLALGEKNIGRSFRREKEKNLKCRRAMEKLKSDPGVKGPSWARGKKRKGRYILPNEEGAVIKKKRVGKSITPWAVMWVRVSMDTPKQRKGIESLLSQKKGGLITGRGVGEREKRFIALRQTERGRK